MKFSQTTKPYYTFNTWFVTQFVFLFFLNFMGDVKKKTTPLYMVLRDMKNTSLLNTPNVTMILFLKKIQIHEGH